MRFSVFFIIQKLFCFITNIINCKFNTREGGIKFGRVDDITVSGNEFLNFEVAGIRVEGGYNSGTFNFDNNKFVNENKISVEEFENIVDFNIKKISYEKAFAKFCLNSLEEALNYINESLDVHYDNKKLVLKGKKSKKITRTKF